MRRSQLLLIILGLLQLNTWAQGTGSLEQYYIGSQGVYMMAPIGSYQFDKGLYFEGRYNYEDVNTFSFYCGKTIAKEAKYSFSITPMAGLVLGYYKGGSAGANISFDYKALSFFSSPQYTFSMLDKGNNFFYNWTDLSVSVSKWLSIGVSAQQTQLYQTKFALEKGFMLQPSFGKWSVPLYVYSPLSNTNRYFVLGLNFEWENSRKKIRTRSVVDPFPFVPSIPGTTAASESIPPLIAKSKEAKHVSVSMYDMNGTSTPAAASSKPPEVTSKKSTSVRQESKPAEEFAISVGPFKNHDDVVSMQTKMKDKFGNVSITSGKHQFWVTGFDSKKEAVSFTVENTFKELKAPFSVVSYKV